MKNSSITHKIVENNRAEYAILIPAGDYPTISYTAKKLQHYMQLSLNARLDILSDADELSTKRVISLGKTKIQKEAALHFDYSTLNLDGFFIKSYKEHILIDGDSERAVAFGCYDFLERFLGIRFVAFDETYIPKHISLLLPKLDMVSIPAFSMRCYLDGAFYKDNGDQDFCMQKRMNSMYLEMDKYHGGASSLYGRNVDHNMHFFVPMDHYEKTHPEFYRKHETLQTTICLTNGVTDDGDIDDAMDESVIKIVIEEMKKDILALPHVKYFLFEQEDGDVYCECERCQAHANKYQRSGVLIRFCNILARELNKWSLETLNGRKIDIVTFAYGYAKDAPVVVRDGKTCPIDETVISDEHLVIRLAYGSNAYYSYRSEKQHESILKTPNEWQVVASRFMFWGYDKAYNNYLSYYPSLHNAKQNIVELSKLNLSYMMIQSSHDTKTNIHSMIGLYLYSKLMWDMDANFDELKNEFFTLYFGQFSNSVQAWFDRFDNYYAKLFCEHDELRAGTFGNYSHPKYISLDFLDSQIADLERIEVKIQDEIEDESLQVKYLKRIARVKVMPLYSKLYYYEDYYPQKTLDDKIKFKEQFFECCELGDIDFYREEYPIDKINELVYTYHFKD